MTETEPFSRHIVSINYIFPLLVQFNALFDAAYIAE